MLTFPNIRETAEAALRRPPASLLGCAKLQPGGVPQLGEADSYQPERLLAPIGADSAFADWSSLGHCLKSNYR